MGMKIWVMFMFLFVLTGCMNESSTLQGKVLFVDDTKEAFTLSIGDELTDKQRKTRNYDEDEKVIEAVKIERNNETTVSGEVQSFDKLRSLHKVEVVIGVEYEPELVSVDTLFSEREDLPTYEAKSIHVIPYTKEEVIDQMTAREGEYSLYVFNPVEKADGSIGGYGDITGDAPVTSVSITSSFKNGVKNRAKHLNIAKNGPTYIVTDEEGVVFHSNQLEELKTYFDEWKGR